MNAWLCLRYRDHEKRIADLEVVVAKQKRTLLGSNSPRDNRNEGGEYRLGGVIWLPFFFAYSLFHAMP